MYFYMFYGIICMKEDDLYEIIKNYYFFVFINVLCINYQC